MMPVAVPQKNNLTKGQRRSTYAIICIISLLGGVEYAVILPTLYQHLQQTYNAPNYFLGIVLAGFSFSGLFASPIMGRFYDKTRRSKLIISLTNLFECGGSVMYWIGLSPWFLLASRLVTGLGNGFFPVVLAEISHGTSNKERTSIVSAIMAMRQFGLLLGPAFNLFLAQTNFYIGPFIVDKFSSPGIFMAVIWIVAQILLMIMYKPLTTLKQIDTPTLNSPSVQSESTDNHVQSEYLSEAAHNGVSHATHGDVSHNVNGEVTGTSQQFLRSQNELQDRGHSHEVSETTHVVGFKQVFTELMYHEYVAIFMLTLVALFNQTGVETLVTPLCYNYMGWTELEVSLMYCGAGVLVLTSFLIVGIFSKRFQDRTLVVFGLVCQIVSLSWFFGWVPVFKPIKDDYYRNMLIFFPGLIVNVFGLPFLFVCHIALFSKLLSNDIQGFGQGLRRTVAGIASILGPLWTGSLLDNWYMMLGVMLGLNLLALLLLLLSFKRLYIPVSSTQDTEKQTVDPNANQPDEKTPLINT